MTAPQPKVLTNSHLYDEDFYLWLETTAKQLKAGKLERHDFINMTYGCLADDPIIRHPQSEYEKRETIE